MVFHAWQFLVVALAGWLNRQQQDIVAYLAAALAHELNQPLSAILSRGGVVGHRLKMAARDGHLLPVSATDSMV